MWTVANSITKPKQVLGNVRLSLLEGNNLDANS